MPMSLTDVSGTMDENEPPRILHVRVINHNDFVISDMYDSVPYVFAPHAPVSIPVDAAAHIFGWWENCDPAAMKRYVQKRFGWNTPDMQKSNQHEEFFKKIDIKPMLYRLVPMAMEADPSDNEGEATDVKPKKAS